MPLGVVMLACLLAVSLGSRTRWVLVPCASVMAMSVITRAHRRGDCAISSPATGTATTSASSRS
ncbi:hypothetical protein [Brachybacterium sp. GPGPB12]|uniref:hypothetical protein n=1 Tax=Brachybacterium sp. GPGPB12 TaxID=3023517 RepID=UPI00313430DB